MRWLRFLFLAARRLRHHPAYTLSGLLGLVAAVALCATIPLYADTVNYDMFRREIEEGSAQAQGRPPFALMFRYVGAWNGPVSLAQVDPLDDYLLGSARSDLGLPLALATTFFRTETLRLVPADTKGEALAGLALGAIRGLEEHIELDEGRLPTPAAQPVDVLVSRPLANRLGLTPGQELAVVGPGAVGAAQRLPVRIAGVWRARDAADDFWFYDPRDLENIILVSEPDFRGPVVTLAGGNVDLALWYMIFDGSRVRSDAVGQVLGNMLYVRSRVAALLPDTTLDLSPLNELLAYRERTASLTILLYAFSVPALGLVAYFIMLTAAQAVSQQRGEIAILKSRGAHALHILALQLLEGILMGALAFGLGLLIARPVAALLSTTASFLSFGARAPLPVYYSRTSALLALAAASITLVARTLPALAASRLNIVSYKRERARALARPLWQRTYFDFLLLVPALYGYYLLRGREGLVARLAGDPFREPLLILAPAFFLLALSLLAVRIFPWMLRILDRIFSQLPGIALVVATRALARSPESYAGPLLLLILTLSIATFTASMARTLDGHLTDQIYYEVGADLRLVEFGVRIPGASDLRAEESEGTTGPATASPTKDTGSWSFLPVSEHLAGEGVRAAARVGYYLAVAQTAAGEIDGHFLGIDRIDFPRVAYFRPDFSPQSLGALMNALSLDDSALLVSRSFLGRSGLNLGDRFPITVRIFGLTEQIEFTIAGVFDHFPTGYPSEGPLFVGNLEYLFAWLGGPYPYDVWLATEPGSDTEAIISGLAQRELEVETFRDARAKEQVARDRVERNGLYGLLSVGTLASAILTVIGFLLHNLASYRRRYIELGVVRAMGFSLPQMALFLIVEQGALIAGGLLAGTGLGLGASYFFIPFMQPEGGRAAIPPFAIRIAGGDVFLMQALFGVILVGATAILISFLARLRIFEAVKLGETA
ncbi:MAG: ABC transporter permease [Anaerolineae bacterium]|nr:ABC transporter permease [Anaerolineae bacterium]